MLFRSSQSVWHDKIKSLNFIILFNLFINSEFFMNIQVLKIKNGCEPLMLTEKNTQINRFACEYECVCVHDIWPTKQIRFFSPFLYLQTWKQKLSSIQFHDNFERMWSRIYSYGLLVSHTCIHKYICETKAFNFSNCHHDSQYFFLILYSTKKHGNEIENRETNTNAHILNWYIGWWWSSFCLLFCITMIILCGWSKFLLIILEGCSIENSIKNLLKLSMGITINVS